MLRIIVSFYRKSFCDKEVRHRGLGEGNIKPDGHGVFIRWGLRRRDMLRLGDEDGGVGVSG